MKRYSLSLAQLCKVSNISTRSIQRWRKLSSLCDLRKGPKVHSKKLSQIEEDRILSISLSEPYYDYSPLRIVPMLADKGIYVASESSFYRILRKHDLLKHRGRTSKRRNLPKPNAVATKPNEVWVWDITNLPKPCRKQHYKMYMFMDLFSRKIVGWDIHDSESDMYSSKIFKKATEDELISGQGLTLHSDNGGPMRGYSMLSVLERLGVRPSFSRPYLSTDNAYAESMFKTLKYGPLYPQRPFIDLEEAKAWMRIFVRWYNETHLHSGIGYVTPNQRHSLQSEKILEKRNEVYRAAKEAKSIRWSKGAKVWEIKKFVGLTPQLLEKFESRHLY